MRSSILHLSFFESQETDSDEFYSEQNKVSDDFSYLTITATLAGATSSTMAVTTDVASSRPLLNGPENRLIWVSLSAKSRMG